MPSHVDRLSTALRRWTILLVLAALPARAQSIPGAVLTRYEPHHHLAYEDSTLRVLRVRVLPHDTTLLHEHDPDYFWIALGASEVVNARFGAPEATIRSPDLSVHYTLGNFAHVARNPGGLPFDNITVELLAKQTNVRNLCEPALAGQPLACEQEPAARFSGASEHPAFASDQLRVSLVTIRPGAVMQPTAEAKHAWVIALDSSDAGRDLAIEGSGRWTGGTFRPEAGAEWRLRNRGSSPIRVLTVVPLSGHSSDVSTAPPTNSTLLLDPQNVEWRRAAPAVSRLRFETTKGVFVLELHRDWGPIGADRLYNLARLGYYDDTRFHRVNRSYIAQFGLHGNPAVNAAWKDQYQADDPPRSDNARGTFAFAFKAIPNTRNTQIYINLGDNHRNDGEAFTMLGTVVEGMPVLDSLYSGYGESSGSGMRQGKQGPLEQGGNSYMDREFPMLDRILRVTVTTVR